MPKMPWEQFRSARFHSPSFHSPSFFGVVTAEGEWVDSAVAFDAAVKFACMHEGLHPESCADMLVNMNGLRLNIVHCSMLKTMYEAGLLK